MEVRGQRHYEVDVDQLFAIFGNPEVIRVKHTKLGSRNIDIKTCALTERSLDLEIQREVPIDAPSILKKFLGEWNHLTQTESWKGEPGKGYQCTTSIQVKGTPVSINGVMSLRPNGEGCVNEVVLNIECKIPLVGGKLAEFVGATSKENMNKEFDYLARLLTETA